MMDWARVSGVQKRGRVSDCAFYTAVGDGAERIARRSTRAIIGAPWGACVGDRPGVCRAVVEVSVDGAVSRRGGVARTREALAE